MLDESSLRDRYRGCLLGLAVGDALGAPVEFLSREEIARRHGKLREMIGGGWLNVAPGETTDDTEQALVIARSVVEFGRIKPAHIAEGFVTWYQRGPKDVGNTTERSIRHLIAGSPWHEAGRRTSERAAGRDASNGSLMRTAPVALACRADPDGLTRASLDVSAITHAHPLATWSCVALGRAIVAILDGEEDLIASASKVDQAEVREAVLSVPHLQRDGLGSGGFVLDTLRAALWALCRCAGFEETVVEAVSLGGDADTTGAVAGALAGARDGEGAIPERWLGVLRSRDEIAALAGAIFDLSLLPGSRYPVV